MPPSAGCASACARRCGDAPMGITAPPSDTICGVRHDRRGGVRDGPRRWLRTSCAPCAYLSRQPRARHGRPVGRSYATSWHRFSKHGEACPTTCCAAVARSAARAERCRANVISTDRCTVSRRHAFRVLQETHLYGHCVSVQMPGPARTRRYARVTPSPTEGVVAALVGRWRRGNGDGQGDLRAAHRCPMRVHSRCPRDLLAAHGAGDSPRHTPPASVLMTMGGLARVTTNCARTLSLAGLLRETCAPRRLRS